MNFLAHIVTASIPLYNAYQVYKNSSFKIPESWKRSQFHPSQDAIDFADSCGVRGRDMQFFHTALSGDIAQAFGNNSISQSDIAIVIDSALVITEPSEENDTIRCAANAIMRHEYTHIRNNDGIMLPCVTTVASTVAAILGCATLSALPSLLLTSITSVSSYYLYSQFLERRADDAAIKHSDKKELQAFLKILKQGQTQSLLIRRLQGLKAKLIISSTGDNRFDLSHPSMSSRIAKLEKAISYL